MEAKINEALEAIQDMEGPNKGPMKGSIDPYTLLTPREHFLKTIEPLPTLDLLYTKVHLKSQIQQNEAIRQIEQIQSKRAGDLLVVGYNVEADDQYLEVWCACGERYKMHRRTVQRHLDGEGLSAYYAPVGSSAHFPAPEPAQSRYSCPHIEEKLSKEFPRHYRAWQSMKKQVQTRNNMYPASRHRMKIETPWFHKATGFAQFVLDMGLPENDKQQVRKEGRAGMYGRESYRWTEYERVESYRARYPELSRRYYALRSSAAKHHRRFQWSDFPSFVESVKPPDSFNDDPSAWRLRWDSPYLNGYSDSNYRWERLNRVRSPEDSPWNQIAAAEEMRQSLPLDELGLTLDQYQEALILFGLLLGDCNNTDPVEVSLEQAIETVKQRKEPGI